ncbi:sensor histidine kinase [Pedobacter africanus]|uniref:Histidine kinase n=1 Tax=Pedobacter africanus TaxID=151894 RepID=A0A1W2CVT0_9SPHI|nr:histidine kinase [Pedobacter africanus]SMC89329.1 Histidine kinase [Pedobacter africanus]
MGHKKVWHLREQILPHLLFWISCTACLTVLFTVGLPSYTIGFSLVMMLLPVHILYFYTVRNILIPKFLFKRRCVLLGISLVLIMSLCALLYRLIEIIFADPYLYEKLRRFNPTFKWKKIEGSFSQQLFNKQYMIHALEQSNSVVWIGLVIKFVGMWFERKQVALSSELNFLKAQIHPHFLFNTLNNLYSLTLNNSPNSPAVVLGLSEILRYMLYECNSDLVPLKRDIEIIKSYVTLEKIRYEDRLDLNLNISGDILNKSIAPLLMIPLIENAFKHGASEMTEDAWINIDLDVQGNRLKFKVSNGQPAKKANDSRSHFEKIGVSNVRKRLELIYPGSYTFTIYDEEDIYVAILEIILDSQLLPTVNKRDKHNDQINKVS